MKYLKYFKESGGVWLPSEEGDSDSYFGHTYRTDEKAIEYGDDKGESITDFKELEKFLRKYSDFLSSETFDPFYDPGKSRVKQLKKLGITDTEWVDYDHYYELNFWQEDENNDRKIVGSVEINGKPPRRYLIFNGFNYK